jgi:hypothetical protein
MPTLKRTRNTREYISGFVDGEGCFSVSFSRRHKLKIGWETKPSFSASQNQDRAEVLSLMQKYFKCGFIRRDFSDQTLKYEVRSLTDLVEKIIPHFEGLPLLSSKQKDFVRFAKICRIMNRGMHKRSLGLRQIIALAFQMNASGKRKYTQMEILKSL